MESSVMRQKDQIVEETASMFATLGIKGVRMDDIAQRLGISKRTLYELFGDKEELMRLSLIHYFGQQAAQFRVFSEGAQNVIEAMLRSMDYALTHTPFDQRMLRNLQRFYPTVYTRVVEEIREEQRTYFRMALEEGVREGLLRDDLDLDLSLAVFSFTINSIIEERMNWLPEHISTGDAVRYVILNFLRGLATVEGIRVIDQITRNWKEIHES